MARNLTRRDFLLAAAATATLAGTACTTTGDGNLAFESVLSAMSIEQKIAQLIMPAMRTWEGEDNNLTSLDDAPKLAEALRRHQYCGVILFGSNIEDAKQTTTLVYELQVNNAQGDYAKNATPIPYLIAADQEGGSVARLSMGTRGTGSMAIGATGSDADDNALQTGRIFGQELCALGINVNLAPCIDVITNLADQGMSTRVFSDDPDVVALLGRSFADGVGESNVVSCFKHFPGAGDGSDYPTAIPLSLEELREQGLVAFSAIIETGADMIMTSATTFPAFDDEHALADGTTMGCYPATMSPKIVGDLLRKELEYDGVIITDALEMDQFFQEPTTGGQILSGQKGSVEWAVQVAQKCLEAGCDILLIPSDLASEQAIAWYDSYIEGIANLVSSGVLSEKRINESVDRILALKQKYGLMDADVLDNSLVDAVIGARAIVGSDDHHDVERAIAEQAVTLLKDDDVLPVPASGAHVVIIGRTKADANPIGQALSMLVQVGALSTNARVVNRLTGQSSGKKDSATKIIVDCYYDFADGGTIVYSQKLSDAIADAQYVVCLSAVSAGLDKLQDDNPFVQCVTRALKETHEAGAKFVLLSDNIPVDAARYTEADAIVCAYLSAGFDIDPTEENDSQNTRAINANVPAALCAIFGLTEMTGTLPINIQKLKQGDDGTWAYTDEVLYKRGSGHGKAK